MSGPRTIPTPTISEAEWQAQVVELAGLYGWSHLHVRRTIGRGKQWVTATNVVGWPDLMLWHPDGRLIFAELKSGTGQLTAEQRDVLASLAHIHGAHTYVWRPSDLDAVNAALAPQRKAA